MYQGIREVGTDVVVYDLQGNEIARFDRTNRKITVHAGAVLDVDAAALGITIADSTLARSVLIAESAFLDLEERLKGADGADLALSETAGDFFRNIGTNQWMVDGEATVNETEASVGLFNFVLPENYVAGGTITLQVSALVVLAGDAANDATSTIDMEARKVTLTTGAIGSDLVATAAQTLATAGATYSFTVTPTGLVAGDKLVCKLTTSVVETAGGTGAANSRITRLGALLQVKG
jgi:Cu/Ag efflux protein CusF